MPYRLVLKCSFCELIPHDNAQVSLLAEHFTAEHDDLIEHDEDGTPRPRLDMVVLHEPCGVIARPIRESRHAPYRCPDCGATFPVYQKGT